MIQEYGHDWNCEDFEPSTGILGQITPGLCGHWWGGEEPGPQCEKGRFCHWAGRPPEGRRD